MLVSVLTTSSSVTHLMPHAVPFSPGLSLPTRPLLPSPLLSPPPLPSPISFPHLTFSFPLHPSPPPRKVQLDATLRSLFHCKGRDDPEQLTWNELMSQFMENLRPAYQVALPGGEVQVRWVGGVEEGRSG